MSLPWARNFKDCSRGAQAWLRTLSGAVVGAYREGMHLITESPHAAPTADPRIALPSRAELQDRLVAILRDAGVDWAWQGAPGAQVRWLSETGPADLDLWWRPGSGASDADPAVLVERLCRELPAAPVADSRDPARLRHTSLVVRADSGLAIIDLTHGDLRVGPITLMPAELVSCTAGEAPQLTGAAAAADLLIRPVLRGRLPVDSRIDEARAAWASASVAQRSAAQDGWRRGLGSPLAREVVGVLEGATPTATMVSRARRRLIRATLEPRAWPSTWRQRRTIAPAGRHASPLGLRGRGVVVALVGTDGSGKSTVSAQVRERLEDAGFATSSAYFGMARGNLPGVALARKALGVGGVKPATPVQVSEPAPMDATQELASEPADGGTDLDRPLLRRAAAWYYAAEYIWRYQRTVAPPRRRGSIVLVDRYVYDLRESPWPGSMASRVAEALVPRPDILVLPDAPDAMIHARKPERSAHEQAAIQARYRSLLAERPARFAHVVVDTSGSTADPVAGLELAVISAAHMSSRESRSAAGAATHQGAGPR
jgi:thymidylate kinase